jgi:hypothetical protein
MSRHAKVCLYPRILERLWEIGNVVVGDSDECWIWHGRMKGQYGITTSGKASRVVLEIMLGRPIGARLEACHTCDNPPCVNPTHLYEGTHKQNMLDMQARKRQNPNPEAVRAAFRRKRSFDGQLCKACRREFCGRRWGKRRRTYCSKVCELKTRGKSRAGERTPRVVLACATCGTEFRELAAVLNRKTVNGQTKFYCSLTCSIPGRAATRREKLGISAV